MRPVMEVRESRAQRFVNSLLRAIWRVPIFARSNYVTRTRGYSVDLARRAFLQLQQSQPATRFVVGALAVPHSFSSSSADAAIFRLSRLPHSTPFRLIICSARTVARGVSLFQSSFDSDRPTCSTTTMFLHRMT